MIQIAELVTASRNYIKNIFSGCILEKKNLKRFAYKVDS